LSSHFTCLVFTIGSITRRQLLDSLVLRRFDGHKQNKLGFHEYLALACCFLIGPFHRKDALSSKHRSETEFFGWLSFVGRHLLLTVFLKSFPFKLFRPTEYHNIEVKKKKLGMELNEQARNGEAVWFNTFTKTLQSRIVGEQSLYYNVVLSTLNLMPSEISKIITNYSIDAFLEEGALIDILDAQKKWCIGQVTQIVENSIRVHYLGWADKWDEKLDVNSDRISQFMSKVNLGRLKTGQRSNDYSLRMAREASLHNVRFLLNEFGFHNGEQIIKFFEDNGQFMERNDIINVLVYWRLFGGDILPQSLTHQLMKMSCDKELVSVPLKVKTDGEVGLQSTKKKVRLQ
jgi:hypothetical protein